MIKKVVKGASPNFGAFFLHQTIRITITKMANAAFSSHHTHYTKNSKLTLARLVS